MAFNTVLYNDEETQRLLRAPRLSTVPLPVVYDPFFIRASLAHNDSYRENVLPNFDFAAAPAAAANIPACATLTADEASRPATVPPTAVLRIVHKHLDGPVLVHARPGSNVVTVFDVLHQLYAHLWSPLPPSVFNHQLKTLRRREVSLSWQERTANVRDEMRRIDLLEGVTRFGGLVHDIAQARQIVGCIDGLQAVTWILLTEEPIGLGPYQRMDQWR